MGNADQQSASAEIRIAKVAIINVTLWTLAWTPFTVICMLGTWGDVSKITPLVSSIPVIIAKTSCCYNPVIYAISHPKYRECLKEAFPSMCIVVKKEEQAPARDNASEATQDLTKTKTKEKKYQYVKHQKLNISSIPKTFDTPFISLIP